MHELEMSVASGLPLFVGLLQGAALSPRWAVTWLNRSRFQFFGVPFARRLPLVDIDVPASSQDRVCDVVR